MQQLSIFDVLRAPPVRLPVDPDGPVLQKEPDFTYRLEHPRMAWDYAEIEVHQHTNGLWMWSTSYNCDMGGGGYRVGEKWGKFAETQGDALYYACVEIENRLSGNSGNDARKVLEWVKGIKPA